MVWECSTASSGNVTNGTAGGDGERECEGISSLFDDSAGGSRRVEALYDGGAVVGVTGVRGAQVEAEEDGEEGTSHEFFRKYDVR